MRTPYFYFAAPYFFPAASYFFLEAFYFFLVAPYFFLVAFRSKLTKILIEWYKSNMIASTFTKMLFEKIEGYKKKIECYKKKIGCCRKKGATK